MLNSFALAFVVVRPLIDIGLPLPLTTSLMPDVLVFVVASSTGAVGTRGTLKKPKTSRYSSSLGAGFNLTCGGGADADVTRAAAAAAALRDDDEEEDDDIRGWREMRKSRSNAQRRMSARILTDDGVMR